MTPLIGGSVISVEQRNNNDQPSIWSGTHRVVLNKTMQLAKMQSSTRKA